MSQGNSLKYHVDENVVRLVATQVFLLTLITLLTEWAWLGLFSYRFWIESIHFRTLPISSYCKKDY